MKKSIPLKKIAAAAIVLLLVACSRAAVTEDENIKLEIAKSTFSLSEEIEIEITVLGDGLYFHGPCSWWFEKETEQGWNYVGECPNTGFVDEPFPQQPGDRLSISLPVSYTINEYTYNYALTAGVYRYGMSYGMKAGRLIIYSPPFEIVGE